MRLQLTRALLVAMSALVLATPALAQPNGSATATAYRESGGGLETTVLTPNVSVGGLVRDRVRIDTGWEADVVSGASVAVVDAPSATPDVITSATRYHDLRNTGRVGLGFLGDTTELDVSYSYGRERDYYSHGLRLGARTELFERNTVFEISYARGWDSVCNLRQPMAQRATDRQRLPTSDGCYGGADRIWNAIDMQTFQGAWTQAWAPIFLTQLTLSAQLVDGFQGNPYRAVWLGQAAAQENHPTHRARYSMTLDGRLWLRPLHGALRWSTRLYRDTWDVASITAELGYEQAVGDRLRVRARGRYYKQRGAAFYSDDYVLRPRGQYFTGDRELSPMSSVTFGGQLLWTPIDGQANRRLDSLSLLGKFDVILFQFHDFHYGNLAVPNRTGLVATLDLRLAF